MTNTDKNPAHDLAPARNMAPTPDQIKQARNTAGQTQQQAADMVYVDGRAWRRWESGDRQMDRAHWELYQIKTIGLTLKK
jgi:DNA-binding transcriptional regulator YiaG